MNTKLVFMILHGYSIGVSRRSAQATAGKGLAQSPYTAARAGVEPTTLRLKVIVSTKAPPRPTLHLTYLTLHYQETEDRYLIIHRSLHLILPSCYINIRLHYFFTAS